MISFIALCAVSLTRRAEPATYLADITAIMRTDWPNNRTINIVCHGHSVPAGYFQTPGVNTADAYPRRLALRLAHRFSHAVINVIVTAIGGENSEAGAKRFASDVLTHHPDVVTIDYSLNDRGIGLERARRAWVDMIQASQRAHVKVILLTPTPDQSANLHDPADALNRQADQVRMLANGFDVALVDSLEAFKTKVRSGTPLSSLMSQVNHPNRAGHELVAQALDRWFP